MMAVMEDRELLEDYLARQSEAAFAQLVERHLALVYSTALRITGQPAQAEDVAQTVFITLARQAGRVRDPAALPGWLYQAACHASYNALRAEKRRRANETAAMQITDLAHDTHAAWARLAPLLDEAMARLSAADQNLVVRRFFEGRSLREVGEHLGLTEDAAQKRVSRALEKLREYFSKNGVAIPAMAIIPSLMEHAVRPAPAHLAPKISAATAAGVAGAGNSISLIKLLTLMSQTKLKLGLIAALCLALTGSLGWSIWANVRESQNADRTDKAAGARLAPRSAMPNGSNPAANPPGHAAFSPPSDALVPFSAAADKVADKSTAMDHAAYGRQLAIAVMEYSQNHQWELPADISVITSMMTGDLKGYNFTFAITGPMNKVKSPSTTFLLKEDPYALSDGRWGRSYVYVDGHVEVATSDTIDFSAWERERSANGTAP
ncbi:MAG TPA: sigma-70 family RNA polymerase sigma factor [Opitutales bacterium]|nr:sigma-70 family RNA polymerase sigma factor [Opitutales bacterium]